MNIEFPVNYVVISIFIGYMYHYLQSEYYNDVISLKSVKVGIVSGFLISSTIIVVSLITTNSLDLINVLGSMMVLVLGIIISIVVVLIGGLLAITVKKIIISYNQRRL